MSGGELAVLALAGVAIAALCWLAWRLDEWRLDRRRRRRGGGWWLQ